MRIEDLTGKKFNKLTVIELYGKKKDRYYWKCKCDCGKETIVMRSNLPKTKSCGCANIIKPHMSIEDKKLRECYYNMRKRCLNPNHPYYKYYGGKGVTISDDWNTLNGFLNDMSDGFKIGLTLDRIDYNKGYSKENCRWITMKEQANNTSWNKILIYKGEEKTLSQIADIENVKYYLLQKKISKLGMNIEEAIKSIKEYKQEEITYNGMTKNVSEFAKEYGMTYHQLKKRLMRGWDIERALNQPLMKRG